MAKVLLILIFGGALISELPSSRSEPPLLIDAAPQSPSVGR
jgi:hypothetical protein